MKFRNFALLLVAVPIVGVMLLSLNVGGRGGRGDIQENLDTDISTEFNTHGIVDNANSNSALLLSVMPAGYSDSFKEAIRPLIADVWALSDLPDERLENYALWLEQIEGPSDYRLRQEAEQGSPRAIALLFYYFWGEANYELTVYYGRSLLPLLPLTARQFVANRMYEALAGLYQFDEATAYLCYVNVAPGRDATGSIDIDFWAEQAANDVTARHPDVDLQMFDLNSVANECRQLAASIYDETMATVGGNPYDFFWAITAESAPDVMSDNNPG
ncbi:MAG: hypothetical protein II007_12245 [Gammaproteobacteria bacterium]|nr:hypothetical protein [Gammaproteobacteria bacterium]